MSKVDLIIIGAGPGGYRAAEYAAKKGLKVVIFEGSEVGGTCLNVGCIPTKTYVHSSTFDEARERMAAVVAQLRQGVEGILSHPNITLVREKGVFKDAHTIGDYTADNIIIATGSETKWLPIKGSDDPRVVDSTGLLQLETLPKRLTIIGAGVIGMEFASIFTALGSEVTMVEFLKECLPAIDSDIAKRLKATGGNQILAASWDTHGTLSFPATLHIIGFDRVGVLHQITGILSQQLNMNIHSIHIDTSDGLFTAELRLGVHDAKDLQNICRDLKKIEEVEDVRRF